MVAGFDQGSAGDVLLDDTTNDHHVGESSVVGGDRDGAVAAGEGHVAGDEKVLIAHVIPLEGAVGRIDHRTGQGRLTFVAHDEQTVIIAGKVARAGDGEVISGGNANADVNLALVSIIVPVPVNVVGDRDRSGEGINVGAIPERQGAGAQGVVVADPHSEAVLDPGS